MIDFIEEINRILWAITSIGSGIASTEAVTNICSSQVIYGRFPDHNKDIEFCAKVGIVKSDAGSLSLTQVGKELWAANPSQMYELTEQQRKILAERCFLADALKDELRILLEQFSLDFDENTFFKSKVDALPISGNTQLLDKLIELDVILESATEFKVNPAFTEKLVGFTSHAQTLSQLKEALARQEEIGNLAESIVYEFEKKRISGLGFDREASMVRIVSHLNTVAGYDVESFDGKSENLQYDRFIEVKGSTGSKVDFFWSKNEFEVANRLGKRYWLYYVGMIDEDLQVSREEPIRFQDPVRSIFLSGGFKIVSQLYHVKEREHSSKAIVLRSNK